MGHQPSALDVEPLHGAKALGGDVLRGGEKLAAGIVDEQIDAAVTIEHAGDQGIHLGLLADVAGCRGDAILGRQGGGLAQGLGTAATDLHRRAEGGEFDGDGPAKAGPAARHERHLAVEQAVSKHL